MAAWGTGVRRVVGGGATMLLLAVATVVVGATGVATPASAVAAAVPRAVQGADLPIYFPCTDVSPMAPGTERVRLNTAPTLPAPFVVDAAGDLLFGEGPSLVEVTSAGARVDLSLPAGSTQVAMVEDAAGDVFWTSGSSVVERRADGTTTTLPISGLSTAAGVAVDGAGDVFVGDKGNQRVLELTAGGTLVDSGMTGTGAVVDVAVDGAGNRYALSTGGTVTRQTTAGVITHLSVTAAGTPRRLVVSSTGVMYVSGATALVVVQPGGTQSSRPAVGSMLTIDPADHLHYPDPSSGSIVDQAPDGSIVGSRVLGVSAPVGLAVDPAGTIYVAGRTTVPVVLRVAGDGTATPVGAGALTAPGALATDAAGDLFVADGSQIKELAGGSGAPTVVPVTGLVAPVGLAFDTAGDLFVADAGTSQVVERSAGGVQSVLPLTLPVPPSGVAVDSAGNVWVTERSGQDLYELPAGGAQTVVTDPAISSARGIATAGGDAFVAMATSAVERQVGYGTSAMSFGTATGMTAIAADASGGTYVTSSGSDGSVHEVAADVPGRLTCSDLEPTPTGLAISWPTPRDNGAPITGYRLTPYLNGTALAPTLLPSTATSGEVTGLTPGTDYGLLIEAFNAAGTSSAGPSNPMTVGSPGMPTGLTEVAGDGSVTLSWTPPTDNGTPISGYVVSVYRDNQRLPDVAISGAVSSTVMTGLDNHHTYGFFVRAVNALGYGLVAYHGDIQPVGPPGAPTNVAGASGNGSAVVSWAWPASGGLAITSFTVTPYLNGVALAPQTFGTASTTATVTGLTNGQRYTFAVSATDPEGTGPAGTSAPVLIGLPGAPAFPNAVSGDGSVTLSWSPADGHGSPVTAYSVTPLLNGIAQPTQAFGPATSETITGLTNGQAYTFAVVATNALGDGPAVTTGPVTVGLPGAPAFLSATPGNGSIAVSFWPPSGNGSSVTSYVVEPTVGVTVQPTVTVPASGSSLVLPVSNGSFVTVRVAAVNAVGQGPWSPATVGVTAGAPLAPTSVTATSLDSSVRISWKAPTVTNGAPITGYLISSACPGHYAGAPVLASSPTSGTVTSVANGWVCTFSVSAQNGRGPGLPAVVGPITVGVPAAPGFLSVTSGNGSAKVSWWAPSGNGSPITGYVITPYLNGVAQAPRTFSTAASSDTVTGLTNGSTYTFAVAAVNAAGTGPVAMSPAVKVGLPAAPGGLSLVSGNASVKVSWSAPSGNGSSITGYVITPYAAGVAQAAQSFPASPASQTITGLVNGTSYTFKVAAVNGVGTGPAATTAAILAGLPSTPGFLSVASGNGSAKVSWWAPSGNGSPITGYVITPYLNGVAQPAQTFASSAASEVVTGLTNGATYTFKVAAVNAVGTGPTGTTLATLVGLPAASSAPTATPGNASAKVTWTAPSGNGSSITGYVITPYLNGVAQPAQTFASAATTEVVTGLTNGATYTFKVAAVNAIGTGPLGAASAAVTVGVPLAPGFVHVVAGTQQATISWWAPNNNGSPITAYRITPYVAGVAQPTQVFASAASSEVVTGLTTGTAYTFKVTAVNANGIGLASSAAGPVTVG